MHLYKNKYGHYTWTTIYICFAYLADLTVSLLSVVRKVPIVSVQHANKAYSVRLVCMHVLIWTYCNKEYSEGLLIPSYLPDQVKSLGLMLCNVK